MGIRHSRGYHRPSRHSHQSVQVQGMYRKLDLYAIVIGPIALIRIYSA